MPQVMVVDDSIFIRSKARKILSESGYSVLEAATGSDAVHLYATHSPDCVLLDITMPDMDGLTALEQIKEFDPTAKVAMVTALGAQKIVMEAMKAGATDFIVKPFTPERLNAAVQKMVG